MRHNACQTSFPNFDNAVHQNRRHKEKDRKRYYIFDEELLSTSGYESQARMTTKEREGSLKSAKEKERDTNASRGQLSELLIVQKIKWREDTKTANMLEILDVIIMT